MKQVVRMQNGVKWFIIFVQWSALILMVLSFHVVLDVQ